MTWVKMCGITRRVDAEAAVGAGAAALGFVIATGSVRRVTPEQAAEIGRGIDAERFLVAVDLGPDELLDAAARAEVTGVQPHGRNSPDAAVAAISAGYRVLFPVPVAGPVDLGSVPDRAVPILDTAAPGRHGGTGMVFDWGIVEDVDVDFVLAGGLDPGNVGTAVRRLHPWGVDVSSGIEAAPGRKDHEEMRRFVEAAGWS